MTHHDDASSAQGNADPLQLNEMLLLQQLEQLTSADSLDLVRLGIADLQNRIHTLDDQLVGGTQEERITIDPGYLCGELEQIAEARTLNRAQYYIQRLIKSITEVRTSPINDINLNRWKAYDHVLTDSLWVIDRRDSSGAHTAGYWGNYIPQIPRQMMLRYTKQGEWVLDPFLGCGTTSIEGQRLGRHTIGIELQASVADQARQLIKSEANPYGVLSETITGDSLGLDFGGILDRHGQRSVQLIMLHPPYFDIIRFSDDPRDLSNAATVTQFLDKMGTIVDKVRTVLDQGRYLVLVIGDKYAKGEWIPLGFLTMNEITQRGFTLKSTIVKNFEGTAGKRSQAELWRYRALVGGFYVFKHEYIFVFQKR
jgi:hypothetical protein